MPREPVPANRSNTLTISPLQRTENVEDGSPYSSDVVGRLVWQALQRASSGKSAKHTHDRWDFPRLW